MHIISQNSSISSPPDEAPPTYSDETVTVSLSSDPQTKEVLVSVAPPSKPESFKDKTSGRAPLDICCVIDVSGSMSSEASIPADPVTGKPAESNGLSVLDVVKHSLRTIVSTMQPGKQCGDVFQLC
jgi:hypothetical protein